jgi:transcriptional regulator with XRE-family HTH domain
MSNLLTKEIGSRMREAREKLNVTQEKLSEDLGSVISIDRRKLGRFENGQQMPSFEEAVTIAEYLRVSIVYLLWGNTKAEYVDAQNLTGLSGVAIKRLNGWKDKKPENIEIINLILSDSKLAVLFSLIYLYASNPVVSATRINKITGKQELVDIKERKAMMAAPVLSNLSILMNSIADAYSPTIEKELNRAIGIMLHDAKKKESARLKQKDMENEVTQIISDLERQHDELVLAEENTEE